MRAKGTRTTQTLRKDDGQAKHNNQTTPAERIAIKTAPELKDNDSRNAFTRHLADHQLQTSTLSNVENRMFRQIGAFHLSLIRVAVSSIVKLALPSESSTMLMIVGLSS